MSLGPSIFRFSIGIVVRVVAVNVLVLATGVVTLEIAFGNWIFPNQLNQLHIPKLVHRIYDSSGLYPGGGMVEYKRDRYGFRGLYPDVANIDVLAIGGSTTDQRYIDEGKTWQDILRRNFARFGCNLSVVNAGVDGQSTYGHIKNFHWWFPYVPKLRVRYFLFYVGLNDFYKEEGDEYDLLMGPSAPTLKTAVQEKSALYYLYRTLRGIYLAEFVHKIGHHSLDREALSWTTTPKLRDHRELMRGRLDSYKRRLLILSELVRKWQATPIFVTQPSGRYRVRGGQVYGMAEEFSYEGVSVNGVDYYYMLREFNRTTVEVGRSVGAVAIDLAGELEFADDDFYDESHNTPQGTAKIGDYLYRKLDRVIGCESQRTRRASP
jgi:hypothetical protein